jgi:c-di-GMP-binding flagellar brake protein YcgR
VIVLDEAKLNHILNEMAEGLARSPLEIALFIILVSCIILAVVVFNRRQLRAVREEKLRRSQRLFGQGVRERKLGFGDVSLLESMAAYLGEPSEKHLLLDNQSAFNTCARKLLAGGCASGAEIAALRLKLGFVSRSPEQVFLSSAQLYKNMPVVVAVRGIGPGRGIIQEVKPNGLCITLHGAAALDESCFSAQGTPVRIAFQAPSGRFVFTARVRSAAKGILEVSHTEQIKRLQRRQFYRRNVALPVHVKRFGVGEETIDTTLFDLGGGGASLSNRDARFVVGDRVSLFVASSSLNRIQLTGEVIRVSKNSAIAHIRFSGISEPERDRIMGFVLKPQESY